MSALVALSLLAGCSTLRDVMDGERVDYKTSGAKGPSLDVPPDLTQLSRETRYVVPGTAVSASNYQVGQPAQAVQTAAVSVGDVRIERAGSQRWLVVNRPADKLWGPVRDFWLESGFLLSQDQENLGIMETDYAENRAKLPQDFIRSALGKVLDGLYSTGERDKFRTRLERRTDGGTEIYVSHRGMVEVITGAKSGASTGDSTVWQPRPADPELEAEFLRRLMVKLGVTQEQSKALVAAGTPRQTSRIATVNNQPVVQIDEGFERAWRRVGLALDRTGFTVEDRDRSKGTYFVRYVEPVANKTEPGFFSKLFSGSPAAVPPLKYQITVKSQGESTTVAVLNAQGAPEASANAQRIVQVIADDLK
ncbi:MULTISPECIES: outer membrane protein assembly factor BamC [unclassified Polaromonas]|uniref:outer membrane protein assembly factor BamC n=1 Tax=unclassified Polaromonas TaxID=2638319 RepID=UPI000F097C8B|nr:outer membrane protein assembly factor BamC [Polaromonas sp. SP1]QGJ19807.1 outer membrane protein assembly factor BamC [Polaromonas sp. Pch-P]